MKSPSINRGQISLQLVTGYREMSDAQLVILCRQDNTAAFQVLVRRYQRPLYNLLYQMAPDWNNIADLAQEVFIRAWRSIHNLRNPNAFRSWLNQIATNLFYDELRKRPKQLRTVSLDEPLDMEDGGDSPTRDIADTSALPDECVQRQELCTVLRQAMDQLPEQFRVAIVLRELEGLSYDEIACLTHSEMGTVKSRIARARAKIQELVQPYLNSAA